MRSFLFFIMCITTSATFSQSGYPAFGKADIKELLLKECSFEKGAEAMKLLDLQEIEIKMHYELKIEINRRVRIKIFNEKGFSAANITIPFIKRNRKSKINDITAYIYNIDSSGKITTEKLEKKFVLKGRSEDMIGKVTFTFPNVRAGSVIEYRFTHSEKNVLYFPPWFFQDVLPTAVSSCKFIYPEGQRFDVRFINADNVINNHSTNSIKITRTFTQNNVHSFKPEPMMSSVKDNLQRVEFAFLPRMGFFDVADKYRWGLYNSFLLSMCGYHTALSIPGTEAMIDSAKRILATADKINYIYQAVKRNLSWDKNQSFFADDLIEAWQLKSGNSAEINLSIINLLRKSGVTCYPVLISTRTNGKPDRDFLSIGQFNGIDVLILDSVNNYLLDGTQKYISYKVPPLNVLNRDVFLIDTLNHRWLTVDDERPLMKTIIRVKAELSTTGDLKGNSTISYFDHSKANKLEGQDKKKNEIEKDEGEDENKDFIAKDFTDLVIDSLIEENADDDLLPLIHKFNFTYKLSSTNNYFILDPFFLSNFRQNPFSDSLRHTNIDMGSNQSFTMYLHLTIPENFLLEELPKNVFVRSNDSSMLFKRAIVRQDNILVFTNSFDILRPIYEKDEYPGVKEYFKHIYGAISDRIVLKRKQ